MANSGPSSTTSTSLRLSGIRLPVARAAFVVLSLATIVFFSMGVPLAYERYFASINLTTLTALQELGLSAKFYATYQISLVILLAVAFGIAGLIVFWKKSDDWLALLVAFTLIGQGANAFSPLNRLSKIPAYTIPVNFVISMVLMGLVLSCYLFPDGKIPKRWMIHIAAVWSVWLMVSTFWVSFPFNLHNTTGRGGLLVYDLALLAALGTGIYAQIYRYRTTDHPIKREQLKWIVFGVTVAILVGVGVNIFDLFYNIMKHSARAYLFVDMFTQTLSVVAQFMVPVAVVFSILRHRLYDIELVINRSLIYGSLTVFLVLIFGGILLGLQAIFEAITKQKNPPTIGIVAATVAASSLFQPARRTLRRFINHKFYGIEIDFDEISRRNALIHRNINLPSHNVTSIDRYTGLELIARGGMGEVYKARHPNLNRPIAIKILSLYFKGDADFHKRFEREAKMMAQLKHPNIINIYDYGEHEGLPYIVMEYLTGETLSQLLEKRGRIPLEEALPLFRDLASALDYAHGQQIIHRDIKPSNIIVEPITTLSSGRMNRAVLMDFGIARIASETSKLTITGDVIGTASYIPPEQVHCDPNIDHRSDIYSFGVVVYEALTGKKPFDRENPWAVIRAHLEEPPPDPRVIVDLPEPAARAIMKAMAKDPEDRFASAGEFVSAARQFDQ